MMRVMMGVMMALGMIMTLQTIFLLTLPLLIVMIMFFLNGVSDFMLSNGL
jgi:hypothetical protein